MIYRPRPNSSCRRHRQLSIKLAISWSLSQVHFLHSHRSQMPMQHYCPEGESIYDLFPNLLTFMAIPFVISQDLCGSCCRVCVRMPNLIFICTPARSEIITNLQGTRQFVPSEKIRICKWRKLNWNSDSGRRLCRFLSFLLSAICREMRFRKMCCHLSGVVAGY